MAERADDAIGAETAAGTPDGSGRQFARRSGEEPLAGAFVRLQQRADARAQRGIRTSLLEIRVALSRRERHCLFEQLTLGRWMSTQWHQENAGRVYSRTLPVEHVADFATQELIARARGGDAAAEADLIAAVYPELRRLARRYLSGERKAHTLQTTDIIHEAWLRLFGASDVPVQDRNHLVALMATQMRRALVDYARRRNAAKREDAWMAVTLTDVGPANEMNPDELIALDDALERLEPRQRQIVECRFFAGMDDGEIAAVLGVTDRTVRREWVKARAWLNRALYSES